MKKVAEWIRQARTSVKMIFGIPDYERYLAHHKSHHPDQPMMSEKEFYIYALKNRYESGTVNRCC